MLRKLQIFTDHLSRFYPSLESIESVKIQSNLQSSTLFPKETTTTADLLNWAVMLAFLLSKQPGVK